MYNKKQNEKPLFAEVKPCDDEVRQQATNKKDRRQVIVPYFDSINMQIFYEMFGEYDFFVYFCSLLM